MLDFYHRCFHTTHIHITEILQNFVTSRVFENVFVFDTLQVYIPPIKLHTYLNEPYSNVNVVLGSY